MHHFSLVRRAIVPVVGVALLATASLAGNVKRSSDAIPLSPSMGHCATLPRPTCGYGKLPCCCDWSGAWAWECISPTECNTGNGCQDGDTKAL